MLKEASLLYLGLDNHSIYHTTLACIMPGCIVLVILTSHTLRLLQAMQQQWAVLEQMYQKNKTRAIGVGAATL